MIPWPQISRAAATEGGGFREVEGLSTQMFSPVSPAAAVAPGLVFTGQEL